MGTSAVEDSCRPDSAGSIPETASANYKFAAAHFSPPPLPLPPLSLSCLASACTCGFPAHHGLEKARPRSDSDCLSLGFSSNSDSSLSDSPQARRLIRHGSQALPRRYRLCSSTSAQAPGHDHLIPSHACSCHHEFSVHACQLSCSRTSPPAAS